MSINYHVSGGLCFLWRLKGNIHFLVFSAFKKPFEFLGFVLPSKQVMLPVSDYSSMERFSSDTL